LRIFHAGFYAWDGMCPMIQPIHRSLVNHPIEMDESLRDTRQADRRGKDNDELEETLVLPVYVAYNKSTSLLLGTSICILLFNLVVLGFSDRFQQNK